jgi:hypothetical protein
MPRQVTMYLAGFHDGSEKNPVFASCNSAGARSTGFHWGPLGSHLVVLTWYSDIVCSYVPSLWTFTMDLHYGVICVEVRMYSVCHQTCPSHKIPCLRGIQPGVFHGAETSVMEISSRINQVAFELKRTNSPRRYRATLHRNPLIWPAQRNAVM